mgnify:CR=1 FL=1
MLALIVVGFGLFSLGRLQLDLYPDISFPSVIVITNYTGASPEDIETLVSRPLEGAVASVKNVKEIESTSKQSVSLVQAKFDWGMDMEQAETDVRRALEFAKSVLPTDADDPIVFAFDPSMQPIVMFMISGPYPLNVLREIADRDIAPRLERLPGIANAEAAGGLEREIHVLVDPVKAAAFGLDVNNIIGAVYRENAQVPGGAIEQGSLELNIQTRGKYQSVADIREVVVGMGASARGPKPIRLKEVAQVEDSFYESQRVLEVEGVPAVWMMVRKQSGANTVRAAEAVINEMPKIKRAAAAEIDFKVIFNQAEFINQALGNLSSTGLLGVVITFLVLLYFLRSLRSSLIVALAIPASVVATFGVMDQAGMTLNMISMAGLALAIGMLVDNAIVVLENIFRLREEGHGPWEAAIEGARGVDLAVTASTLTTVAVFFPVLFVPGIAGVMFRDMSVTITFSLLVSLAVALTLVPLAASRLLGQGRGELLLHKAQAHDVLANVRKRYGALLERALRRRWVVGTSVGGALVLTALLALILPTEFITDDDDSFLFVSMQAPVGSNLEETTALMHQAVAGIEKAVPIAERRLVSLDVGVGKGFVAMLSGGVHTALVRMPLVEVNNRKHTKKELEAEVRKELAKIPGLTYSTASPFNMAGGAGDIEVQIRGHDLDVSRTVGLELRDKLRALPEMANVTFSMEDQKPEMRVRLDRLKLGELGISGAAVGNAINAYFMGRVAGRYAEGGDEFDILVRYPRAHRTDVEELRKMPVATPSSGIVPLGNVAEVSYGLGPTDITRLDQERITRLTLDLKPTYENDKGRKQRKDLGASIARVDAALGAYPWPQSFTYHIGGSAEDFQKSFKYLGLALIISIFLVYMVMASQFESLREPFIIIFTVPLAAIGVVLLFVLTRSTMDVSALVGVIMLVGIVVNNGIVMVDAANQLREKRALDRRAAILQAALMRLRPVILTSATTILAMVPLALEIGEGSAGWGGMAKAVIGGLLTATFLTLFVVPVMYTIFAKKEVKPLVHKDELAAAAVHNL